MEKKNQNPLPPHYPEQESFEEYTNPDPNEINPQQYENRDDYGRSSRRQSSDEDVIVEDKEQESHKGYDIERQDDEDEIDEEEDEIGEEEDEYYQEDKSPLRPIDANKSPEEWRKLPQNQPQQAGGKTDYDSVPL